MATASKISKDNPSESWMSRKIKSGCGWVSNQAIEASTECNNSSTCKPCFSTFRCNKRAAGFSSSMINTFMGVGYFSEKSDRLGLGLPLLALFLIHKGFNLSVLPLFAQKVFWNKNR